MLENGHVNTGFEAPLDETHVYTNIDDVTEDVTTTSKGDLTIHNESPPTQQHPTPGTEAKKVMETFDLIADLENKSVDEESIDAKTMLY